MMPTCISYPANVTGIFLQYCIIMWLWSFFGSMSMWCIIHQNSVKKCEGLMLTPYSREQS